MQKRILDLMGFVIGSIKRFGDYFSRNNVKHMVELVQQSARPINSDLALLM